jgi:hypothetical protein
MKEAILNLLKVKSLVTLALTGVMIYGVVKGVVDGKYFETVYTTIIAFYFGTQYQKARDQSAAKEEPKNE